MRIVKNNILLLVLTVWLSSCTVIQQEPDNRPVRLVFYNELNVLNRDNNESGCHYLGPVISSEGHWYSYLFITNEDLTYGAINDMLNKANRLGANLIYVHSNIDFATSVTLVGQAYNCPNFSAPPLRSLQDPVGLQVP